MKVLLDVNILLACGWQNHQFHSQCAAWLGSLRYYALCPITELGFLRVSMSPAFGATFADAMTVLRSISGLPRANNFACDLSIDSMSEVSSYKDTTDAYLVQLADHHAHRLATLDSGILKKSWAEGIAFDPLAIAP